MSSKGVGVCGADCQTYVAIIRVVLQSPRSTLHGGKVGLGARLMSRREKGSEEIRLLRFRAEEKNGV